MSVKWFERETLDRIIPAQIRSVEVVLDIGCGIRPQSFFEPALRILCEPYPEYVRILQNRFVSCPNVVILQGGWEEVLRLLPDKSVDSIFLIDVIEHLEKAAGHKLLKECERLARQQIVLFTPLGMMPQDYEPGEFDGWGLGGIEWQVHKSGWAPEDFDPTWDIWGAQAYHHENGKGQIYDPPVGAFWAVRSFPAGTFRHLPVKLAVLSQSLPPSFSDQAIMLGRILEGLDPNRYCLISSGRDYGALDFFQNSDTRLPAHYHFLGEIRQVGEPSRFRPIRTLQRAIRASGQGIRKAWKIAEIVRREHCGAIVACSGNRYDIPAAFLASRLSGAAFYAYLIDDYIQQWIGSHSQLRARVFAFLVLRGAAGIVTSNEFLDAAYRQRYGIESKVIHNPGNDSFVEVVSEAKWPRVGTEIKIVYTEAVDHPHYDALRDLITTLGQFEAQQARLYVYTSRSLDDLQSEAIGGPRVVLCPQLSPVQATAAQRHADILFFPLAFQSDSPEVIQTSAPGKLADYLTSGRPILVYAPPDTFLNWYFRHYECGIVVGQREPTALLRGIQLILGNPELCQKLVRNAQQRAKADFGQRLAQVQFAEMMQAKH